MVRFRGSASRVGACGFLGLFGTDTSGALVQHGVHVLELGDALDMLVGIVQVVVTRVSESLMPEEAFRSSLDGSKGASEETIYPTLPHES